MYVLNKRERCIEYRDLESPGFCLMGLRYVMVPGKKMSSICKKPHHCAMARFLFEPTETCKGYHTRD